MRNSILPMWFLLSFLFFFFFLAYILSRRRLDVYHTSTPDVAINANLECMSEMCCTQLAEDAKNRPIPSAPHFVGLYFFTSNCF